MNIHKILLVEENEEISKMLKKHLTMGNYKIICIADGQEACRLFDSADFSLVLLDLMIPGNGMDVIRHIRKNSVAPIIILSSNGSDAVKTQVFSLGADDFITKPFSVEEVIARIQANIRRVTQYVNLVSTASTVLSAGDLTMNYRVILF